MCDRALVWGVGLLLSFAMVACYMHAHGVKTELGGQVTKQGMDFLSFYTNRQ